MSDWDTESCEPEYTPNDDPTEIPLTFESVLKQKVINYLVELVEERTAISIDNGTVYAYTYWEWEDIAYFVSSRLEWDAEIEITRDALLEVPWWRKVVGEYLLLPTYQRLGFDVVDFCQG